MSGVRFKRWEPERLLEQLPARIVREYGEEIAPQLQDSIAAVAYQWPRATRRKVGRSGLGDPIEGGGRLVKKGPRDVIDTGRLQDSQQAPVVLQQNGRVVMRIAWTAPYSFEVLTGSSFVGANGAQRKLPGRDWISPVLAQNPPGRYFVARWKQLTGG